ncbi:hypothetical protein F3Y22_tig00111127pilonHSYRG00057 [Hibiscus syriacus]|uniref:Uncharacterized protein n=1 Tax=Hibiscus syriacus TaxID=106335 RepID=A0A6A2YYA4_HIBSY|nr:hypothetical protein F3Y22_tig00111127pilonHSYRG00057 [Hibiscus syriacus]
MTLLASSSMRNMETVNDSGLVLREFFDPEVTTGSLLGFQSFDQQPSCYSMNEAISPREQEDVQAGQQFIYLASGETSFPQFTGITPEVPYTSKDFVMKNVEHPEKGFMPASIEVLETSENADKIHNKTDDADLPPKYNLPVLLPQNLGVTSNQLDVDPEMVENKEPSCDEVQTIVDDLTSKDNSAVLSHQNPNMTVNQMNQDSEVVENKETSVNDLPAELAGQPAAKKMRLMLSLEEKVDS